MAPRPPDPAKPFALWDVAVGIGVLVLLAVLVYNVFANMHAAGMVPGFGFLTQEAGFDVSESLIPFSSRDSYARVILTGLLNTLFLAAVSLLLANAVGLVVGLMSVSASLLGRLLAAAYVELFRNLPKLLILLVLYVAAVNGLPPVRQAISLGSVHISNRAINLPWIVPHWEQWVIVGALIVAIGLAVVWQRTVRAVHARTGQRPPALAGHIVLLVGIPTLAAVVWQVPLDVSLPQLENFDFAGGGRVSLQFMVIAITLALYHGAQIGEVIRGGIEAVPAGQIEAARALGLRPWIVTRQIVLPQVLRIVIPPLGNQYINLLKNTSVAIAIGYSDLMSVAGTIINQTFRPLEMMLITMTIYLALCLVLAALLERGNRALRAEEVRQ